MVCMNYGEYANQKVRSLEAEYPTFLYAMPMTKTKVLFEETCLPSKDVIMPIDLLKTKLMLRVGGSLPKESRLWCCS
ncbi:lycopene epsilon cyclase, chloroplastic-like [Brassica napus]|uniref:lycopene epsilon cyclase, chloroplastic-like n=1 Tax=Brassica napus TaxID=3708 RepID=UPI002078B3EB|nr:lycopene epsilon cyclase, chloroplastic-like [Brassica napus]